MVIHASAPGTLMLMGEHAVLHGKQALVAATDQRLHVYVTPRQDRFVRIHSALGEHECSLDTLEIKPPFTFLLALISVIPAEAGIQLPGLDIEIRSEFSARVGLGSSAAVLVATCLALGQLDPRLRGDDYFLFDLTYKALIKAQGRGSGADLAAAIRGGIIAYRQTPFSWHKLDMLFPITLVYAGYKTPTPEVIQMIDRARASDPEKFAKLFDAIDEVTSTAIAALKNKDSGTFAAALTANQDLMCALGVVDATLQDIIIRMHPLPAQVSGSGLGDCVIGLGTLAQVGPYLVLPAALSSQGVLLHEH